MKKWKPLRTEFYESAVQMGYYGREDSGLTGKKDNVRKYWEDVFVKLLIRPFIEEKFPGKKKMRILDLGCGSGEGFELLTHIPPTGGKLTKDFVIKPNDIERYCGLDVSTSMVTQGKVNYSSYGNVSFEICNLDDGLPASVLKDNAYDLYFSTYGAVSHLSPEKLKFLSESVFRHAANGAIYMFDTHGKYSPSWPKYWAETSDILPYTMAYLLPSDKLSKEKLEWFNVCYWSPVKLKNTLLTAAKNAGCGINFVFMLDRSIFVGRHMDTGLMSTTPLQLRYQVNRLLDHGYRGEVDNLIIDLSHLEQFKKIKRDVWERLTDYQRKWNKVIYLLDALMHHEDTKVKDFIENTNIELMSDDLKFITWLFRNADRFPVVDYWASVIGPQVAVVLRNLEMSYTDAVGCGHGLICGVEIVK